MKVMILGEKGWLGSLFKQFSSNNGVQLISYDGNINNLEAEKFFGSSITHIVNFAASANIDWCESNKEEAFKNNVLGAINVARVCAKMGIKHVFVSSACIFQSKDKNDVQFEDSTPNPGSFYTRTKLMAEELIKENLPESIIVRLRLPISEVPHPRNALNKLSSYEKLVDSQESATIVEDFIPRLYALMKEGESGDFNLVNSGTISPSAIGEMIGSNFVTFSKKDLDTDMKNLGRAHRVSTIVGTKRKYGDLPPLKDRLDEVVWKWRKAIIN